MDTDCKSLSVVGFERPGVETRMQAGSLCGSFTSRSTGIRSTGIHAWMFEVRLLARSTNGLQR